MKEHSDLSKGIIALSAGVQPPMMQYYHSRGIILTQRLFMRSILDQVKDISKDTPNKLLSINALLDLCSLEERIFEHKEAYVYLTMNKKS